MAKKIGIITVLIFLMIRPVFAEEIIVKVRGMVCGFCARGIEKKFSEEKSVSQVVVSLENKTVQLLTQKGQVLPDERIQQILKDSGYETESIERKP